MPWPTVPIITTGMDADTDALPRADILDLTTKFNQLIAMRGVANGVCDLDGGGLVPSARIPALAGSATQDFATKNLTASGPITSTAGELNLKTNTALADAAATLTAAQLKGGEFTITPTVARILTTDTAANIIAALTGSVDNNHFEINIINLAAFDVTLAAGVGVTLVGRAVVNNGSATWRVRRTSATTVEVKRLEGFAVPASGVSNDVGYGAVGSIAVVGDFNNYGSIITEGQSIAAVFAGGNLKAVYYTGAALAYGAALTGTWRNIGGGGIPNGINWWSTFQRIA